MEMGISSHLAINIAFVGVVASRLIQVREPAVESGSSKKRIALKLGLFQQIVSN